MAKGRTARSRSIPDSPPCPAPKQTMRRYGDVAGRCASVDRVFAIQTNLPRPGTLLAMHPEIEVPGIPNFFCVHRWTPPISRARGEITSNRDTNHLGSRCGLSGQAGEALPCMRDHRGRSNTPAEVCRNSRRRAVRHRAARTSDGSTLLAGSSPARNGTGSPMRCCRRPAVE